LHKHANPKQLNFTNSSTSVLADILVMIACRD
jgi:hypothetical protein